MCYTVQHSIHRHISRYVSKSYNNMKGHGIYSVNTLHIPCSPPFYQIPYLQNTKYLHQNMIHVNDFNVVNNENIPAINM